MKFQIGEPDFEYLAYCNILGALIGAGASLAGGALSMFSRNKQADEQRALEENNRERINQFNARQAAAIKAENLAQRARLDKAVKVPVVSKTVDSARRVTEGARRAQSITSATRETSSATRQTQTGSVDVDGMMQAAAKAGFNPVTWLRNGGLQAYARTNTYNSGQTVYRSGSSTRNYDSGGTTYSSGGSTSTSTTGAGAMQAAMVRGEIPNPVIFQYGQQAQKTGWGEVLGDALKTGGEIAVQGYNQDKQNQFQMDMLKAQIAGRNSNPANTSSSGASSAMSVPRSTQVGSVSTSRGNASLASDGGPKGTSLWLGGEEIRLPAGNSSSEDAESWFGEPGEMIQALNNIGEAGQEYFDRKFMPYVKAGAAAVKLMKKQQTQPRISSPDWRWFTPAEDSYTPAREGLKRRYPKAKW